MSEANTLDRVTGLDFYPGKSFQAATVGGEYPRQLAVTPEGVVSAHGVPDRGLAVVHKVRNDDGATAWAVLSQRDMPELASILPNVCDGFVQITIPGHGTYELPATGQAENASELVFARQKGDELAGVDQGDGVGNFLAAGLRKLVANPRVDLGSLRLLRVATRDISHAGIPCQVNGAEAAPLTMVSDVSIAQLVRLAGSGGLARSEGFTADRLRATVRTDGAAAEAEVLRHFGRRHPAELTEDRIRRVRIGELVFLVTGSLKRPCAHPNIDQKRGQTDGLGKPVLDTRHSTMPDDPTSTAGSRLGLGLIPEAPLAGRPDRAATIGTIALGDEVVVMDWLDEPRIVLRAQ